MQNVHLMGEVARLRARLAESGAHAKSDDSQIARGPTPMGAGGSPPEPPRHEVISPSQMMTDILGGQVLDIEQMLDATAKKTRKPRRILQGGTCYPFNLVEKFVPDTPLVLPLFVGQRYCGRLINAYGGDLNRVCEYFFCEIPCHSHACPPRV
jgi:hypothetical protein|eukprot:COSAG01_NODE_14564_length_1437_cov_8.301943_2_plen_153_part_00